MIHTLLPVFLAMTLLMLITLTIQSPLITSFLYFLIAYLFVVSFEIPLNPFMSQAQMIAGNMEKGMFFAILATQLIAVTLTVSLYHYVFA